jgi:four helix bundle protein
VNRTKQVGASEKENRHSTFEDLEVYQVAREFRKAMYRVARRLPDIEKFALANQIRRAAVSLTNNIAEAHGRYRYLDQIKFLCQSRGSLQELIDDLNVCMDEQYLSDGEIAALKEEGWRVRQLIDGYVRYLRDQKNSMGTASVRETSPTYDDIEELDDDSRLSI